MDLLHLTHLAHLYLNLLVTVVMIVSVRVHDPQLAYDYYKFSCPLAETMVKKETVKIFLTDVSAPPAFLRLFFHDCKLQVSEIYIF